MWSRCCVVCVFDGVLVQGIVINVGEQSEFGSVFKMMRNEEVSKPYPPLPPYTQGSMQDFQLREAGAGVDLIDRT